MVFAMDATFAQCLRRANLYAPCNYVTESFSRFGCEIMTAECPLDIRAVPLPEQAWNARMDSCCLH